MQSQEILKELLTAFAHSDSADKQLSSVEQIVKDLPSSIVMVARMNDLLDIQSDFNRSVVSFAISMLEENRDEQIAALRLMNEISSKTPSINKAMFMALVDIVQGHIRSELLQSDGVEDAE